MTDLEEEAGLEEVEVDVVAEEEREEVIVEVVEEWKEERKWQ